MNTYNSSKKTTLRKINDIFLFQKPWIGKTVKWMWILFFSFLIGLPLYIFSVQYDLFNLFGGMPSLKSIENPENDLSSEIISADGVSLGRYFRYNRSQVTYEQLSPDLVNTLLLSEDHRFYDHSGIDILSYPRVIWGLLTPSTGGGGSTITQQLAKNLFRTRGDELDGILTRVGGPLKILISKTKEWIISIQLEENYTKEEIITMYLNTTEFSSNAYGIKVAAETYFQKQPDSLNVLESALIVGMLQNPSLYNPQRHPENALGKRNQVLGKLYHYNYIKTREKYDSLRQLPIQLKFSVQNQNQGLATYFRTVLRNDLMKWCKEHGYDLWESGLKIYTTIDSRMQQFAEEAMAAHMAKLQKDFNREWKLLNRNPWSDPDTKTEIKNFLQKKIKTTDTYRSLVARYGENSDSVNIVLNMKKPMTVFSWKGDRDTLFSPMDSLRYYNWFLQSGMMSMDPETGAVKAWVGGINHKYFKYDHVRQGTRQPGSTFKPFVYGKAIEDGYSPCFELLDISPTIKVSGGTWTPKNSQEPYGGSGEKVNLRLALAQSLNSITAQLVAKVQPANVVDFAKRLGITSPLDPVMSLALGTSDVTLYEMVSAYCSFVNLGIHIEPYFITRIEDKNGNVIESFVPKTKQAMDEKTAYKMVYMLQGGVELEGGTSRGLSYSLKVDNEIGGKTGTTDDASDGWYMGITHNLVTGVWVGGDTRNIHFPNWAFGAGSKSARPIWDKYMVKVYEHPEVGYLKGQFKRPTAGLDMILDCSRHSSSDTTQVELEPEITLDDIDN
jgi:penicillin-binding protein 1A